MALPSTKSSVHEKLFIQLCEKGSLDEVESFFKKAGSLSRESLSRGLLACCRGLHTLGEHSLLAKLLVQKGANINHVDEETGMTALMHAVLKSSFDVVELCCEGRANMAVKDRSGKSALSYLLESEEPFMNGFGIEALQRMTKEQIEGADNQIAAKAVRANNVPLVRELVDKGVGFEAKDSATGNSLMHIAAQNNNLELVQLLLKRGLKNSGNGNREGLLPSDLATQPAVVALLKSAPTVAPKQGKNNNGKKKKRTEKAKQEKKNDWALESDFGQSVEHKPVSHRQAALGATKSMAEEKGFDLELGKKVGQSAAVFGDPLEVEEVLKPQSIRGVGRMMSQQVIRHRSSDKPVEGEPKGFSACLSVQKYNTPNSKSNQPNSRVLLMFDSAKVKVGSKGRYAEAKDRRADGTASEAPGDAKATRGGQRQTRPNSALAHRRKPVS